MEAVHGQDSRSLAARHEGTAQGIRQRGFAGPRGTGNGNDKTRFILCPPKNVFDDRFKLASTSCGQRFLWRFLGARHEGDSVGHGIVLRIDDAQTLAQPMNMNPVSNLENMRHVVRDENDR